MKFEWKVEELKFRNMQKIGDKYLVEFELTTEEKLNAINELTDGKINRFIEFNNKYMKALDNGEIKRTSWGYANKSSKKAWIRKHDDCCMFWNGRNKDNLYTNDKIFDRRLGYNDLYLGYEVNEEKIQYMFHGLCNYLYGEENLYFYEHDEYEIIKSKWSDCGRPTFGNHISWGTNGVNIYDDDEENKRPVTIDELKLLISLQEKLNEYKDQLSKENKIKY